MKTNQTQECYPCRPAGSRVRIKIRVFFGGKSYGWCWSLAIDGDPGHDGISFNTDYRLFATPRHAEVAARALCQDAGWQVVAVDAEDERSRP